MPHEKHVHPSEDEIRLRSYMIWENEGRPEGKSHEHWLRAKAELEVEFEAEWRKASLEGRSTTFVLPLLPISMQPCRSVADKIGPDGGPTRAAVA